MINVINGSQDIASDQDGEILELTEDDEERMMLMGYYDQEDYGDEVFNVEQTAQGSRAQTANMTVGGR